MPLPTQTKLLNEKSKIIDNYFLVSRTMETNVSKRKAGK